MVTVKGLYLKTLKMFDVSVTAIFPPLIFSYNRWVPFDLLDGECCGERCHSLVILSLLVVCRNRLLAAFGPLDILR